MIRRPRMVMLTQSVYQGEVGRTGIEVNPERQKDVWGPTARAALRVLTPRTADQRTHATQHARRTSHDVFDFLFPPYFFFGAAAGD